MLKFASGLWALISLMFLVLTPSAAAATWCADHGGFTKICVETSEAHFSESDTATLILGASGEERCPLRRTGRLLWTGDCEIKQQISLNGTRLLQQVYVPKFELVPFRNPETGRSDARLMFSGEPMPVFLPMFTVFIEE